MKNTKGFTLIELLAIIVILAVIMAIAIPQVLNVVNGSKESAWKDNVKMITKAIELNTQLYDAETGAYTYTMTGLCASPDTVNEISKSSDTSVSCRGNVFTVTGTGQFEGKIATIDCSSGGCSTSFTAGNGQLSIDDSCPGCRYLYATNTYNYGTDGSTLAASATKASYNEVVSASGKQYFLGVVLSDGDHGKIEKAFACGIQDGVPFCVEGLKNGSLYANNKSFLNSLYGPYNESTGIGCQDLNSEGNTITQCHGVITAAVSDYGYVGVRSDNGSCVVLATGNISCQTW